ncbi:hypothetical protein HaLaN_10887 [Haematococcus lacustris]|uniref:Uncharacterized protein n=1 Tax=Haematococcus lacustris TaxID=44745 RepID=A0A699YX07_HAELA|nr:hypothetical protein HaLaN_10887 [Haematococcus lacustris]
MVRSVCHAGHKQTCAAEGWAAASTVSVHQLLAGSPAEQLTLHCPQVPSLVGMTYRMLSQGDAAVTLLAAGQQGEDSHSGGGEVVQEVRVAGVCVQEAGQQKQRGPGRWEEMEVREIEGEAAPAAGQPGIVSLSSQAGKVDREASCGGQWPPTHKARPGMWAHR